MGKRRARGKSRKIQGVIIHLSECKLFVKTKYSMDKCSCQEIREAMRVMDELSQRAR